MAKKKHRFAPSGGQSASTSDTKFQPPTHRLEDVHYMHGTSIAAAEFFEVQSKLSRYIGSNAKGAMDEKAIMNLRNLNLVEPTQPIRIMKIV